MRWTVLADNRTNDPAMETEHGLSILLETERHRILLDTGASDMFIRNAERLTLMGIVTTLEACLISWKSTRRQK